MNEIGIKFYNLIHLEIVNKREEWVRKETEETIHWGVSMDEIVSGDMAVYRNTLQVFIYEESRESQNVILYYYIH